MDKSSVDEVTSSRVKVEVLKAQSVVWVFVDVEVNGGSSGISVSTWKSGEWSLAHLVGP